MRHRCLLALLLAVPLLGVLAPSPTGAAAPAAATAGTYLTVTYTPGKQESQRLVLIAPSGAQSTVLERRVSKRFAGFRLVDWSTDGRTALLTGLAEDGTWVERVDVPTGAVVQRLRVRRLASAALDPDGTGLLATTFASRTSGTLRLDRIAWSGARFRLPVETNGSLLTRPDGTVLTGGPRGRQQQLVSIADGSVLGTFRSGRPFCAPVRWWDQIRVLETCGNAAYDLVLVDPRTGSSQQLTDEHTGGDFGHYDARQVGDGVYVEVSGACKGYLGRREADGSTSRLRVPGTRAQVFLLDAVGSNLVLQLAPGCNAADERSGLALFDPVTRVETPLTRFRKRDEVTDLLVLGETRAITY